MYRANQNTIEFYLLYIRPWSFVLIWLCVCGPAAVQLSQSGVCVCVCVCVCFSQVPHTSMVQLVPAVSMAFTPAKVSSSSLRDSSVLCVSTVVSLSAL